MALVEPLRALHYDLQKVESLDAVVSPPYDVIDDQMRAELASRSPFNIVEIDMPRGENRYEHAARTLESWIAKGAVVRDESPALWILTQDFSAPDDRHYTRHGFFARVGIENYGPGKIRPHERTHPGPKEDRLRLTRATKTNLSPIFSLFSDPGSQAWSALEPATAQEPYGVHTDADGTVSKLWRVDDKIIIGEVQHALAERELLIADGHHRYETARVYAEEAGSCKAGFVLMFLCALEDTGLTVFPTHRLLTGLKDPNHQQKLHDALLENFDAEKIEHDQLAPGEGQGIVFGYIDSFDRQAFRLTLKDQAIADRVLDGKPEPYRKLDTAVLEALILKGALGMSEDDISHLNGLTYSKDNEDALQRVLSGEVDAAFFMKATPVGQVRDVAAAGVNMPPKSTYFYPKIPTGLLFNPLA